MIRADREEIFRYLGYRGRTPETGVAETVESCIAELQTVVEPRYVRRVFPLEWVSEAHFRIEGMDVMSRNLSRNLSGCAEVCLMAATLGLGPDRLIQRAEAEIAMAEAELKGLEFEMNQPEVQADPERSQQIAEAYAAKEKEIEDLYYSEEFGETRWDHIGSIVYNEEIKNQYVNDLVNAVDIKPGFKVVIDCACGAGSEISPIAFRKAGCNVITLNSQVDGFFPGRNPEPNDANLGSLKKAVIDIPNVGTLVYNRKSKTYKFKPYFMFDWQVRQALEGKSPLVEQAEKNLIRSIEKNYDELI